jgi:putative endonuclease
MAQHNVLGGKGEDLAADYLVAKGYTILERNWRSGHKEIDLIARNQDEVVFVEVKTRHSEFFGRPEESVTPRKMKLLISAADTYLRERCIDDDARFDVICVVNGSLRHYEGAFRP